MDVEQIKKKYPLPPLLQNKIRANTEQRNILSCGTFVCIKYFTVQTRVLLYVEKRWGHESSDEKENVFNSRLHREVYPV